MRQPLEESGGCFGVRYSYLTVQSSCDIHLYSYLIIQSSVVGISILRLLSRQVIVLADG